MHFLRKFLFLIVFSFTFSSQAGFDCQMLVDDEGNLGPVVVTINHLVQDETVWSDLDKPAYLEDATLVKYQYWTDGGNGYSMVHFVGVTIDKDGFAQLAAKNLFCKDNGEVEEGGL